MTKIKRILYTIAIFFVVFSVSTVYAESNTDAELDAKIYESTEEQEEKGNVTYASDVTYEMGEASYWSNKLGEEADRILLNQDEIKTINQEIIDGSGTGVYDITQISEGKTQADRKASLANSIESDFNYMVRSYPNKDRKLYVDGQLIDNLPYIESLKNAVLTTGFENDDEAVQLYAVGTKRTEVKMYPTNKVWGYDSPADPDDEACNAALDVNEPFVIRAKCTIDEDTFYWGLTNSCSGWVDAKDVALFDSKEEWLESWKVDVTGKDFLVVIQDSITLEPSSSSKETSEVKLKIGTVLKLVPENEIPESVNERGTWNNYVVYLPTRDEDGKYVRSYALIAEHYKVSIGYLPLTQRYILDVAFSCLGNRYGWGGMIGAMDCSAYSRAIYKCFGLDIPRNTTNQQKVPNRVVSFSGMTDEEKEKYIEKLPVGTVLYFSGHAMVYIGSENGKNYVISDTGSLSDSYGDVDIRSMYSVIINPLTTRRKTGFTWLNNMSAALIFGEIPSEGQEEQTEEIEEKDIFVPTEENTPKGNITYADGITSNMSKESYWKDLLKEQNKQIISTEKIKELNKKINGEDSRIDIASKDILVVTQDRIILEPSILDPEISEVELPLGTVLELVPKGQIPRNLAERGPWNNYVVYLPIMKANGEMVKKYALIPEHYNVSIGYLEFTPENIIDVAFRCLGDSYELMDNKTFITSIYNCFGLELSLDSEIKTKLKDQIIDVSNMTIDDKLKNFEDLPVGSLLEIGDEISIYLGSSNDNQYIIVSTSGKTNSIVLNKVTLENLKSIIDFSKQPKEIVVPGGNEEIA